MYKEAIIISAIATLIHYILTINDMHKRLPFIAYNNPLTANQVLMIIIFFIVFVSVIISKYIPYI